MAKLDGLKIDNMQESFINSVSTTAYPVEKGLPITDSVQRQPKTFSISGKILGKTAQEAETIRNSLETKQNKGQLVKYVGRISASDVLITNFNGNYDSNIANGFSASIDLQQIRIAKTPYVEKTSNQTVSGKKPVVNKKPTDVFHTVKKGDTYWALARKYGVPLATLMKQNPWPARKIPIGVKMKIK